MGRLTPRTHHAARYGLVAVPALAWVLLPLAAGAVPSVRGQATGAVDATDTLKFEPATITVAAGGTVTWTNAGATYHTVVGGTGLSDKDTSKINGQLTSQGATYAAKFDTPGTYPYFCEPHVDAGMKGEVVVTAAGGGGATTAPPAATASARATTASPAPAPTSTTAPAEGGAGVTNDPTAIPGTGEDNPRLEEIHKEELAGKDKIGGFNALLGGMTAATVALCGAVFASTRPRRAGR